MRFRYKESVHNWVSASVQQRWWSRCAVGLTLLLMIVVLLAGCSWFKQRRDGLAGITPIHLNPSVRVSSNLANATIAYQNGCGQSALFSIAGPLTDAITRKLGRVFTSVVLDPSRGPAGSAEGTVEVDLGIKQIDLAIVRRAKRTYPVTVTLGLAASFLAEDGTVLYRHNVQSAGLGDVEATDTSCDVKGLDAVAQEAVELVTEGMAKNMAESVRVREFADGRASGRPKTSTVPVPVDSPESVSPSQPGGFTERIAAVPQPVPDAGRSGSQGEAGSNQATALTFRAIVRDQNRDQILQQEEFLTIEIEVKNDSLTEAKGVEVVIGGTAALTSQLPTVIPVGDLQPGEIKRAETSKPIGALKEPLRGELVLTLRAASPVAPMPPAKKVAVQVKPGKAEDGDAGVDVDQPPKPVAALKQPKALVVAIGVGRFRDDQVPMVKYAGRDAEVMASYLKSIGTIPDDRVRVLVDSHALKQDLVEVFEEWLAKRADPATVVYVFVSGRALVDSVTGAVSVVPFDGSTSSVGRLYSVRRMQDSLARLSIHRAILMFDVSLDPLPGSDQGTNSSANWDSGVGGKKDQIMWMVGNRALQEAHAYERGRHGLFTYHLLKGLQGAADVDRDGTVVAGELCTYAGGRVSQMAREQFGNEQEPLCLPPAGQGALVRIQPLARGNNPKPPSAVKKPDPAEPASQVPSTMGISQGP